MHTPVLLKQVLENFGDLNGKLIVDATFGEGGHSRALLESGAQVIAIEADSMQIERSKGAYGKQENFRLIEGDFADIQSLLQTIEVSAIDGALFDLGLSYNQYIHGNGFSYNAGHQPLEMIINSQSKQKGTTRAADVLNYMSEYELTEIFKRFGEVRGSAVLAALIVDYRKKKQFAIVSDLIECLGEKFAPQKGQVFQAIRIYVNDEFTKIKDGLMSASKLIKPGGILQVITFHSLEDRLVKSLAKLIELKEINKVVGRRVSSESYEKCSTLRVYKI